MKASSKPWLIFGACSVVVAAALVWMSAVVLELERAELRARTETDYQESLRSAMWRMDSWLTVFLAQETARPHVQYRPYVAQRGAYDQGPTSWKPGPLTPSPLLAFRSELIPLHFEIDVDGRIASPQLPRESPASASWEVPEEEMARREEALERIRPYLDIESIHARVTRAETMSSTKLAGATIPTGPVEPNTYASQAVKSQAEYEARQSCALPLPPGGVVGRPIPLWLSDPDSGNDDVLVFVRRVRSDDGKLLQGFVMDWPRLRERLLAEIGDLFPVAELRPVDLESAPVDPLGRYLANIPVALVALEPAPPVATGLSPGRAALGLAWLAAVVAAVAVGATLRTSLSLGERRRRFVSAVTHELRTPLTTLQMYSEMLADGRVPDEGTRQEYLRTLKDESRRLSMMVENVLDQARLEERGAPSVRSITLEALLSRVTPPLQHRAEASGMTLQVETGSSGSDSLRVNDEAIGQILRNLVDNAAKYARNGSAQAIHLRAAVQDGSLALQVDDHGPGVADDQVSAIFDPFERGGREPSDPIPGIGLGLALSRGLARGMGGDLTLEKSSEGGACFRLQVPIGETPSG